MKYYFYRICNRCGNLLKFENKNKVAVKPCYCKTCKTYFNITETNDLCLYGVVMIEKTADEMFKELDYYKLDTPEIAYRNEDEIDYDVEIFFYESLKDYRIYTMDDDFTVSVPLHKAIKKQMEELGWL